MQSQLRKLIHQKSINLFILSPQASQKRRPLSRLLEQLLRNLEKRDPNQFFAWPVNDNFAPGYSDIIRRPMDFSTIKQKIDDNEYKSLNCFIVSRIVDNIFIKLHAM